MAAGIMPMILPLVLIILCLVAPGDHVVRHLQAGEAVPLTEAERAWMKAHPDKLTLYFNTEFPPIEFISPFGRFIGLGADIVARIEALLGITFIKTPAEDWNEHLAALERGECAVAPTIVRSAERENYAFFTDPYATVPVVLITSRNISGTLTLNDLGAIGWGWFPVMPRRAICRIGLYTPILIWCRCPEFWRASK